VYDTPVTYLLLYIFLLSSFFLRLFVVVESGADEAAVRRTTRPWWLRSFTTQKPQRFRTFQKNACIAASLHHCIATTYPLPQHPSRQSKSTTLQYASRHRVINGVHHRTMFTHSKSKARVTNLLLLIVVAGSTTRSCGRARCGRIRLETRALTQGVGTFVKRSGIEG